MSAAREPTAKELASEIEDDLASASKLLDLVNWIAVARDFTEAVELLAEQCPDVAQALKRRNLAWRCCGWEEQHGQGLQYLHMEILCHLYAVKDKAALS